MEFHGMSWSSMEYPWSSIQLTLTLKMTTAQVVETSVTVNNNSPIQDYVHPDDQTQPTFEIIFMIIIDLTGLSWM